MVNGIGAADPWHIEGVLTAWPTNRTAWTRSTVVCSKSSRRDGRVAFAELGRRVGLSAPAVAERVGRLERDGRHHRLPGRRRPPGHRLPAGRRGPRAPLRPPDPQDPRARRARRPRSSSASASPARTASCCACTSAPSTTSRRSSTTSRPFGQTTTSIVHSSPVPRRSLPLGRPGVTACSPRGHRSATGPGRRWRTMTEDARPPRPEPASRRLAHGPRAGRARGGRRALAAGAHAAGADAGRSRALPAPRAGAARRARDELAAAGPARARRPQRGDDRGRSRLRRDCSTTPRRRAPSSSPTTA